VAICIVLLALLMIWAAIFPQTGDGDAIMHFLNARDSLWQPAKLMGSWARVGAKLPLLIPAQLGILAARWVSALISIICAWQTIRLADDLKIKNAFLAAPFLIFQPFVFALAADTMTEIPFALGLVIAIRFWLARRPLASCLVVGYLPTVRPEGFFICLLWAALFLAQPRRRIWPALAIGWGTAAWFIACWLLRNDPTYFFRQGWSWPADSLRVYGHGSFFAHINRWPLYCGPILFPLFLLGIYPLIQQSRAASPPRRGAALLTLFLMLLISELLLPPTLRETVLPWPALALIAAVAWSFRRTRFALLAWTFLLIFTLHTILWWRGWFGSCGLMRILACVAPITAIVCLLGWNLIASAAPPPVAFIAVTAMALAAFGYYLVEPIHYRVFTLQHAADFVRSRSLLAGAPKIILGDPMAQVCLSLPSNPTNLMLHNCDRSLECDHLLRAPIGSVGIWDNQHAFEWFNVAPTDLPALGYTVLYQVQHRPPVRLELLNPSGSAGDQIYLVIRKDSRGRLPGDVHGPLSNHPDAP
jgi:hypothetical protein